MLIAFSILAASLLLLVILLWIRSPGIVKPLLDENGQPLSGSLSEKTFVTIHGVPQGMFIQSRDLNNPVLLFLHGGPGMPEYFITESYPTGLEDHFTVVWWDQRGAGLSYTPALDIETITIEQLIADTIEVTRYLQERFGKEKIYLMGHSGGSYFGIQVAAQAPELYYAYIGIGQMTYQLESERLAYEYMLTAYQANGDTNMLQKLEAAPPTMSMPLPLAYDKIRDAAMHSIGIGTTRDMKSVITGVFVPSLLSPQYTLREKINLWRGKGVSMEVLRNEMFATDLTQQVQIVDIPVYFLHGKYDYTCSYSLARRYFSDLQAPIKGFYTFENSAHSPIFEEPEKLQKILLEDVMTGATNLADR